MCTWWLLPLKLQQKAAAGGVDTRRSNGAAAAQMSMGWVVSAVLTPRHVLVLLRVPLH